MSRQIPPGSPKRVFRQAPQHIWDSKQQKKPKSEMTLTELKELFPKQTWKPSTLLMPVPAVMLSCGGGVRFRPIIITVAWAGIVCSDPAMIQYHPGKKTSYDIISKPRNLTSSKYPYASQRTIPTGANEISQGRGQVRNQAHPPPQPRSSARCSRLPINIECKVAKESSRLGSHDLFIAKILASTSRRNCWTSAGKLSIEQATSGLRAFRYRTWKKIGTFGFS